MYTAPDYPQGVCHIRKAAELGGNAQRVQLFKIKLPMCGVKG